ncbi:MAG TPA: FAD-dependent oxidoreductase [Chitinophagaceae bacterium]|nr:FAD-dependent oxidoreductase [Chitinophagaceae bacterium]
MKNDRDSETAHNEIEELKKLPNKKTGDDILPQTQVQVEYLIIGQGLCGTWLSWFLQKENKSYLVIDKNETITPSKVSAGIINPVTGRRMVKVWMAEDILPFAHAAYNEIGSFLNITAISQKNIIDFFPNPHQRLVFLERIEEGEEYLHSYPEQNQFNQFFNYDLGCGEIRHCYIAHLEILLPAWSKKLKDDGKLREEDFELEKLIIKETSIEYKNINAEKIIFCDGLRSFENPYFKQLPFAPNKGEALIVEIPDLPTHHIYKKGFLLSPLSEADTFWFGSNYQWSFSHNDPTKEFYEQGERHLRSWLKLPFKIVDHKATLRPATLERRPFVGLHPHQKNIVILNGMGTKGCSLAPWFAKQLVDNLVYHVAIDPLANINRFQKILSL